MNEDIYKKNNSMIENRIYNQTETELRAYIDNESNNKIIEGYAAKFNTKSRLITESGRTFYEILSPGAFIEVTSNDVYLTFNHDKNKIFARTTNNTLILEEDDKGLKFKALLNDTSGSKDLFEMISRGDVFENSFAFIVDRQGQQWSRSPEGEPIRTISRISKLIDVSVVTRAAYPDTEVIIVRGIDEYFEEQKPTNINTFVDLHSEYINKVMLSHI